METYEVVGMWLLMQQQQIVIVGNRLQSPSRTITHTLTIPR